MRSIFSALIFVGTAFYQIEGHAKENCNLYDGIDKIKCYGRNLKKESQEREKKQAAFDKLDHRISMFKGVGISPLTADQMKLPQARNKGSLKVRFVFTTDKGEKVYRKKECTAFASGKTQFNAVRHCFTYKDIELEKDPELNKRATYVIREAQLTMNSDVIRPHVFDIDLSTIKFDDPVKLPKSESASFEIKAKVRGQYLGELLGYPAMSVGGQFTEGFVGSLPYPKDVKNPCNAVYFNPDERDDVLNRVLKYADNKNRRLLRDKKENKGKVTLNVDAVAARLIGNKNYKICGIGFTDHKKFKLSVVNCYAGGLAHNKLATNCSQTPGMSGGDNYYINGIKHISVVVAQFNNRTRRTTPEEEGVYGPQANLATLLNAHAMTVRYDPDTKKVVKTVLSPITGEQLAEKERQERGQTVKRK